MRWPSVVLPITLLCCHEAEEARKGEIAQALALADDATIRTRPTLSAGKYGRMAASPYDFFRGSLSLFQQDWRQPDSFVSRSRFALHVPLVPGLGDPHFENFGVLRAIDGSIALEPNDFDAADRVPYLWDVRRLVASIALASQLLPNVSASQVADASRGAAKGYAEAVAFYADGATPERVVPPSKNEILADIYRRSERDAARRAELDELTVIIDGRRRLKRGTLDPGEPTHILANLPESAALAVPALLERARASLVYALDPKFFMVRDAAREFGSGVASWTRMRALVLVRGPTDDVADDVVLEIKELPDSGLAGVYPPGIHADTLGMRVLAHARQAWARPDADPLWTTDTWMGLPVQIRTESEGLKGLRTTRLAEHRPESFAEVATELGRILGRVHARDPWARTAVRDRIAEDATGFVEEQARFAQQYLDHALRDAALFVDLLASRGPTLGLPVDRDAVGSVDLQELLGER